MYKLLTDEERENVAAIYAGRRAVVMLMALIVILVVAIIGLLPSYVISQAREREIQERTSFMVALGQNGDEGGLQNWLAKINKELQVLSPRFDTDRPSVFVKQVVDDHVSGIRLSDLSWIKNKNKITLSLNGVAVDRQTLIKFEDKIRSSGHFSGVSLPISDLAQNKNIDFQIKFTPIVTKASTSPAKL